MVPEQDRKSSIHIENAGTRNAVETAIDLSRSDRRSTWNKLARKMPKSPKMAGKTCD